MKNPRVSKDFEYVPFCMACVLALILAMACLSKKNSHPDEFVHVRAAEYYHDHWIPPKVCASDTEHTYSPHGISRLNTHEIFYFFAGKFSRLLSFVSMDDEYLKCRLLNVLLFFVLLLFCIKNLHYRILFLTILASPQIWYVFSYFNTDAFAMFVLLMISYQLLYKNSMLNNFLEGIGTQRSLFYGLIQGSLFSLLFFIKKNFFIFIIFVLLYFMLSLFKKDFSNPKMAVKRAFLIMLIAASIFGLRYSLDIYINGFNKSNKILECQERFARKDLKPSTNLENKYFGVKLKNRGVTIKQMFGRYGWGEISFQSTFGVYGYMSIYPSKLYIQIVKMITALFSIYIMYFFLFKMGLEENILLLIVFVCSFVLVGLALWHSWTVDLQRQGRYFLPIFVIIGFLLFQAERHLNHKITNIFIIAMFLMSSYSFVFIGLSRITK